MQSIRSKNTKPELLVRKFLFAQGFRYRLNVKQLPGSPDIVLKKYRTAIFINGCFWHGHQDCKYFVMLALAGLEKTLCQESSITSLVKTLNTANTKVVLFI